MDALHPNRLHDFFHCFVWQFLRSGLLERQKIQNICNEWKLYRFDGQKSKHQENGIKALFKKLKKKFIYIFFTLYIII